MDSTIIVAVISFIGTLIGTAGGIIASGKLTQYRLEQLEKKVDLHTKATAKIPIIEERIGNINIRISSLEKESFSSHAYFENCQ